jgi:hypothetical protein
MILFSGMYEVGDFVCQHVFRGCKYSPFETSDIVGETILPSAADLCTPELSDQIREHVRAISER